LTFKESQGRTSDLHIQIVSLVIENMLFEDLVMLVGK